MLMAIGKLNDRRISRLLGEAEQALADSVKGYGDLLEAAAESTLAAGGKRIRPLLVFVCSSDSTGKEVVRAAVAVELVHMATLVHDDVIDEARLRRGQPTVAYKWGDASALGTGDYLLARAFALLVQNERVDEAQVLSEACLDLARGELAQRRDAYDRAITEERYLLRCRLKTAGLFQAACMLGALEGSQPEGVVEAVSSFGQDIGVAFQILDDVLDIEGHSARTGKVIGTDLREGTITLPLIFAEQEQEGLIDRAVSASSDAEIKETLKLITATEAPRRARQCALAFVEKAKVLIETAPLAEHRKRMLTKIADSVVERQA